MTEELEVVESKDEGVLTTNADNIIALAEKAELRIEAVKKIKNIALRVTNNNDWCDQNGKPYLECSGSEKVARVFGISWRVRPSQKTISDDGHYIYKYVGEFTLGGATIEAIGSRSSKDVFFTTRYRDGKKITLPSSEVDEANVEKAAYTNCIGNGVTRLLGIRNLRWEELAEAGISQGETSKVSYKKTPGKASESSVNVVSILEKSGKLPFKLKASDGSSYSTYSDTISKIAKEAFNNKQKVRITSKGDKYNTIESIEIIKDVPEEKPDPEELISYEDDDKFYEDMKILLTDVGKTKFNDVLSNYEIVLDKMGDIKKIDVSLREAIIEEFKEKK